MKLARTLIASLFLLVPLTAVAQSSLDEARFRPFEEFVGREMKRDRIVGLSVAVLEGDRLWSRGFGLADLENNVPATERTAYRMGSVSKPMTAVAALKLAEQGKLDLDADIRRYVPYFPDKGKTITTRLLLSHLGGISHYRDYLAEGRIREPKNTREAIAIFENFDLVADPGTRYQYSSYGYNLIGAAIEGATKKPYGEVLRELVWAPANMTSTRLDSPLDLIPFRATGYQLVDGNIKRSDYVDISSRFAGGGTRSNVIDMVRFAEAAWNGKLLTPETMESMWWPASTTAGRLVNYGLGWSVNPVNGHYYVFHSGAQQEARTLLMVWPARKLAIAFASNFEGASFDAYRTHLYWLVTGEVWGADVYAPDPRDRAAARIADRLINAGGFYVEKYGRAKTTDERELRRAFDYVNTAFRRAQTDPAAAEAAIADGIHPSTGAPMLVAGSWIASRVITASNRDDLARLGALETVARYITSTDRHRLDRDLARRVVELSRVWNRTWTDEARRAFADPPPPGELATLVGAYRGLRVAPSHAARLVSHVENSFQRGDFAAAEASARLAADIYPEDHGAAGVWGIIHAVRGREQGAEQWLRRSSNLNPEGYASPRRLADVVESIARLGHRDAASTLSRAALRIHPSSPELIKARERLEQK